jgi:hypothetical protein
MPARESVPELFSPLSNVMGIFRELSSDLPIFLVSTCPLNLGLYRWGHMCVKLQGGACLSSHWIMHDMPARESVPQLFSPLSNVMGIFRELSSDLPIFLVSTCPLNLGLYPWGHMCVKLQGGRV